MENKRNNVLLTIIGVATLLVAIVGASFAYFSASGGTDTQNVNTGTLKVSAGLGAVNGSNIKPVLATNINTLEKKLGHADVVKLPITVDATGTNISAEYDIYLTATGFAEDLDVEGLNGVISDFNWELVRVDTETGEPLTVDPKTEEAISDPVIATGTFGSNNITNLKLNTTPIEIHETVKVDAYKLLIYINDTSLEQDNLQGIELTAFATVQAKQKANQ